MPRYFTLEEARASLPAIRRLMEEARALKARIEEIQAHAAQSAAKTLGNGHLGPNGSGPAPPQLEQAIERLEASVREIEATGCIVKDLDVGLADWPHLRDGHEVYLCWQVGEPDIEYWHEISDGFRGRRPV